MTSTLILAAAVKSGLSAANLQLLLGVLLAISEALGADPRVKANGILSFILIQVRDYLRKKKTKLISLLKNNLQHYKILE